MIELQDALDLLRLDEDFSETGIVQRWIDTLPGWVEAVTGVPADEVRESDDKLLEALEAYELQLLYNPDGSDADRLRITIDSLSSVVKATRIAQEETT